MKLKDFKTVGRGKQARLVMSVADHTGARDYRRRLDRTLERVEDVETGLPVGGERDWDVPQNGLRIHIDDGDHTTDQISHVSLVNSMDVALPDRDRHQEGRGQRIVRILAKLL